MQLRFTINLSCDHCSDGLCSSDCLPQQCTRDHYFTSHFYIERSPHTRSSSRERVSAASDTSGSESNSDDGECFGEQSSMDTSMAGVEMTEAQIFELRAEFYNGMGEDELHNLKNYLDLE